jgi:hypothetical protein
LHVSGSRLALPLLGHEPTLVVARGPDALFDRFRVRREGVTLEHDLYHLI